MKKVNYTKKDQVALKTVATQANAIGLEYQRRGSKGFIFCGQIQVHGGEERFNIKVDGYTWTDVNNGSKALVHNDAKIIIENLTQLDAVVNVKDREGNRFTMSMQELREEGLLE